MKDESLQDLLDRADRALAAPAQVPDLASRVRRADRRRRRATRAAAASLLVGGLVAALVAPRFMRPPAVLVTRQGESTQEHIRRLQAEALQLASDAAVHERVADGLLRMQRRSAAAEKWDRSVSNPDPLEAVRSQRDRAARILVRGAARMEEEPDGAARAMDLYRRTARMFGDTDAGRQAALRVKAQGV